jgi:alkylglycerol monooxygenase
VWLAALTAALWAVGGVLQGRLSVAEVLLVEAAALATASAALGLDGLHHVCKPLALAIAIFFAARRAMARGGVTGFDGLLLAGLVASLVGDVLLMGPARLFVPGLVCFLLAHLAYIALFRIGVGLFPRRGALAATLLIGVGMYAFLWQGGLPAALRIPVAVYVVVIACMAAQAIGRAAVLRGRDPGATCVAVGACFFMLSDALLATNRFVTPLPLASLWVLGTYYAAQISIVRHARQAA